jgi:hypothetical protein
MAKAVAQQAQGSEFKSQYHQKKKLKLHKSKKTSSLP